MPIDPTLPLGAQSPYGYVPTEWICILFIVLFAISTLLHGGQAIYYRIWWLLPTAFLCGVAEVTGWAGRLWSSRDVLQIDPFLMQICCTIMAPSFLTAGLFTLLGIVIRRLGSHYSRLTPKMYLIIFLSVDLAALVIQAVGGGRASVAALDGKNPEPGGNIMMYGIIVQLVGMGIFSILEAEFLIRYHLDKPVRKPEISLEDHSPEKTRARGLDKRIKFMLIGMGFVTLWVFMRSIYRVIELADGWTGRIITTQVYFNVLDGMPIALAMFTLNVLHPGVLLGRNAGMTPPPEKEEPLATEADAQA